MTMNDDEIPPYQTPSQATAWWNGLSPAEQQRHLAPLATYQRAMRADGSPGALATLAYWERVRVLHAYLTRDHRSGNEAMRQ